MRSFRDLLGAVSARATLLVRELGAFGAVGASCFLIQVGCFQLLYAHLGVGAITSNAVATVISMTVAYLGHRFWSFSHRARSGVGREYLLFAAINGVTLLLGLTVIAVVRYPLGQDDTLVLQVANVGSIVLGTVIRYLAYRRWVFLPAVDTSPDHVRPVPVVQERPEAPGAPERTTPVAPLST